MNLKIWSIQDDFYFNSLAYFALFLLFFQAAKKAADDDWDNWFSEQDKELQQIFQGQSAMREVLTDLHRKMDEIITRQERTLQLVQQVCKILLKGWEYG